MERGKNCIITSRLGCQWQIINNGYDDDLLHSVRRLDADWVSDIFQQSANLFSEGANVRVSGPL